MSNSDASGSSGDELKKNLIDYGSELIEPCDSTEELQGELDASKKRTARRSFGEEVVGCNVKVWWPLDQMFYKGKIAYFDRLKRKHRVQYDDGDVELLDLTKERWQILGNDNLSAEEQQEIGAAHASTMMLNDHGRKISYLPKRKKGQQDIVVAPSASTGTLNDHGGKSSRLQKRKKEQQEIVAACTASTKTLTDHGERSSRLLKRKKDPLLCYGQPRNVSVDCTADISTVFTLTVVSKGSKSYNFIKGATKNEDKKGKTEARSSKGKLESAEDNSKKSN